MSDCYCCPVCDYDKLAEPPACFAICPCCGTEFENDDYELGHDELRQRWIDGGRQWWSEYEPDTRLAPGSTYTHQV